MAVPWFLFPGKGGIARCVCVTSSPGQLVASPMALGIQRGANVWILYKLGKECVSLFQAAVCCIASWGVSGSRKGLYKRVSVQALQSGTWKPELPEECSGVSLHRTQALEGNCSVPN